MARTAILNKAIRCVEKLDVGQLHLLIQLAVNQVTYLSEERGRKAAITDQNRR